MKLYESSKMDYEPLMSSYEAFGLEEKKQSQKISVVSDQLNVIEENKDSFVLDIESHSNNNHHSPSSRIMLQRNFSRKGSQNVGRKKSTASSSANDEVGDFNTLPTASTSSPRACCTPKMPAVAVGSANSGVHHQITITASNISATESRLITSNKRSFSFRKSSSSWGAINPRKVLLLFATLSSMGSILLIYLTLSVRKLNGNDDDALVWQE